MRAQLASGNPHKLDELRAALPGWVLELATARHYPPEDGGTYVENARIKARHGAAAGNGGWVIGEDSGIEVGALGGAPGIHSARWADDGVSRLLAELEGVADRRARYVCELVCLTPEGELRGSGTLEGAIAHERRGAEGFGYDPIFVPAGETESVAELGDAWKRQHSHRALAAAALAQAATASA